MKNIIFCILLSLTHISITDIVIYRKCDNKIMSWQWAMNDKDTPFLYLVDSEYQLLTSTTYIENDKKTLSAVVDRIKRKYPSEKERIDNLDIVILINIGDGPGSPCHFSIPLTVKNNVVLFNTETGCVYFKDNICTLELCTIL